MQRGAQRRGGRQQSIVVGDDRGFDKQRQPRRAAERGGVGAGAASACASATPSASREVGAARGEIAAQQQRRHLGVDHRVLRDGAGGALQRLRPLVDSGILQARNYNETMIVVRYVTLAALVLWIGVMIDARFGDALRRLPILPYACGAVVVAGLFVLKFLALRRWRSSGGPALRC